MKDADVVIAGAGPAGATAAILLAASGARVVLLDKATFPRDKLCGEFISPEALGTLEGLGLDPRVLAGASRADSVLATTPGGRRVRLPIPRAQAGSRGALGVPRRLLDAALVERAAEVGVDVRTGLEARGASPPGAGLGAVVAVSRSSGDEVRISGRVLLAADGRDSPLARGLDPARARRRPGSRFALKAHFRLAAPLQGAVELHYFAGGYVGLHDVGGGLVNVCALIDRAVCGELPRDPDAIARRLFTTNPIAAARFAGAERSSEWLAVGGLVFRAEAPAREGVLFLGDAAGTIDPFAGEGISMALRSAEIAAAEILAGAGADLPDRYARRWRAEFRRRIALCRWVGRASIRPRAQEVLLAALGRLPALGRALAASTRAGVPGRGDDAPA